MIALGIVLGYLFVGTVLARRVFDSVMGSAERTYESHYGSSTYWTYEFTAAFWLGITTWLFWPVVFPLKTFVFGETTHEQLARQQAEKRTLDREFQELESRVLEFGKSIR